MDTNNSSNTIIKKKRSDLPDLFLALFFLIVCFLFVKYLEKSDFGSRNNRLNNVENEAKNAVLNIDMNKKIENPKTQDIQEMINKVENNSAF